MSKKAKPCCLSKALSLILISICIQSCGQARLPETKVRIDTQVDFPPGTAFAFSEQSYSTQRSERIPNSQRNAIIKQIKYFFTENDYLVDEKSPYVISFYKEFYQDSEGQVDVEIATQMKHGRLHYTYQLEPGFLANNRDGALVIDIIEREQQSLLRQVVSPFYFGVIQTAYRQSPDKNKRKYIRGINALRHLFGID